MRRISPGYAIAVAIIASIVVGGLAFAQVEKGKKAPDFKLKTIDGKDFQLQPLVTKGKDQKMAVIVAFWGSWCGPCRAEAPRLQELYQKYDKQGLAVIGIAVIDTSRMVRRFASENGLTYTLMLDTDSGEVSTKYGVTTKGMTRVPHLFLLDRNGVVRADHPGYSIGAEKTLEQEIKQLLAENPK